LNKKKLYGHTLNTGTRVDDDLVIWIPKNASSSIRKLGNNIDLFENSFIPKKNIIFLRDPYLRWKSGIVEYMFRHKKMHSVLKNIDKIEFDEHTVPQTKFFDIRAENNIYYNLDSLGFEQFAIDYELWQDGSMPRENQTFATRKKHQYMEKLDCVITKQLQNKIRTYYFEDYKFMSQLIGYSRQEPLSNCNLN